MNERTREDFLAQIKAAEATSDCAIRNEASLAKLRNDTYSDNEQARKSAVTRMDTAILASTRAYTDKVNAVAELANLRREFDAWRAENPETKEKEKA